MKTIKEKTINYKLVAAESDKEQAEIEQIIAEVKEEEKLPFDPSTWVKVINTNTLKHKN